MFVWDEKYAGVKACDKLARLRKYMQDKNIEKMVLTVPEEVAWLLNIREEKLDLKREDDAIIYSPVFACRLEVERDGACLNVECHMDGACLSDECHVDGACLSVECHLDDAIVTYLDGLGVDVRTVEAVDDNKEMTIVSEWKKIKNDVEISNMHKAHLIDGVVMTKFIKWLKESDQTALTEMDVVEHLEQMRQNVESYIMPSFGTIAGYNANGAVIHYEVTEESNTQLADSGVIVVDAGGQYLEGTTDTTRTISLGQVTPLMKQMYTAVLKGHIDVALSVFDEGTTGDVLDAYARKPLQSLGYDYAHGTGHGVGCLLNVHEHPRRVFHESTTLEAGMITSNEPGVYIEGEFGIRIENVVCCKKVDRSDLDDHINNIAKGSGQLLGFENLTVCPYDYELIDMAMLDSKEVAYLERYQKTIESKLEPYLTDEEMAWLKKQPLLA